MEPRRFDVRGKRRQELAPLRENFARIDPGGVQRAERGAHRVACRRVAARKRKRGKMSHAADALVRPEEKFAAPNRPVFSETRAVEDDADDVARKFVVRHAGGHVRVMVLHAKKRRARLFFTFFGKSGG